MDLQNMMEYRNNHNPFCQKVGVSVQELRPNYAKAVKIVAEDDANPVGVAHGGGVQHELQLLQMAAGQGFEAVLDCGNQLIRSRFRRGN